MQLQLPASPELSLAVTVSLSRQGDGFLLEHLFEGEQTAPYPLHVHIIQRQGRCCTLVKAGTRASGELCQWKVQA